MAENEIEFFRIEDFEETYANNVQLESSAWDLKLIFGQLDQTGGKANIAQHTAVTIPWAQAKLLAYFLQANVFFQEKLHGKIIVPTSVLPPDPSIVFKEMAADPKTKDVVEYMQKLRDALVASSSTQ
jgi:hypothetical protein